MEGEQIAKLLRAQPFKPFTVVLPDGKEYHVKYREMALLTPRNRLLVIADDSGAADILDVLLITTVKTDFQSASAA